MSLIVTIIISSFHYLEYGGVKTATGMRARDTFPASFPRDTPSVGGEGDVSIIPQKEIG